MAEVSTIPAYVLANEHLLMWLLEQPLHDHRETSERDYLQELVHLDFHRWNSTRPDHVFQHRWEHFMHDYRYQQDEAKRYGRSYTSQQTGKRCGSLVVACLHCLVDEYVQVRHNRLYIKLEKFGWWQNMLSRLSSLPILALAYLRLESEYAQPTPERKWTYSQLYPYDEGVENYIGRSGLNDSHVHANLCAYAEECWLYALRNTQSEWQQQKTTYHTNAEVPMLYRLIHVNLTPELMEERMMLAKRLRFLLMRYAERRGILREVEDTEGKKVYREVTPENLLFTLSFKSLKEWRDEDVYECDQDPWNIFSISPDTMPDTAKEMEWMMKALERLSEEPHVLVDKVFHVYLLLMNEYYTLCVQRDNFIGFKQFQRYSMVQKNLVDTPFYFRSVFERMHGSKKNSVTNYVELRISPRDSTERLTAQLHNILQGYLQYVYHHVGKDEISAKSESLDTILKNLDMVLDYPLRLVRPAIVVHLIKGAWSPRGEQEVQIRHAEKRKDYIRRLDVLKKLLDDYPLLRHWIRGIDAAAYEMDTPPDVFAPAFRKARHELQLPHATYHAGEDFYHLVSGIRAVCETVDMLGFMSGDRIGHASALGVEPTLWINTMPGQVTPTRGEWLMDLVFAWNMLQSQPDMHNLVQRLNYDIRELGYTIFEKLESSPHVLKRVFDLRYLDPLLLQEMHDRAKEKLMLSSSGEESEPSMESIVKHIRAHPDALIKPDRIEDILAYRAYCNETVDVLEMILRWQGSKALQTKCNQRIEVNTNYFAAHELRTMQQLAMKKLVEKSVIVETLPTSNLRIGQYKEIGQHHSLRWIGPYAADGDVEALVVLGSDDPGVFATDIKAEFYHLFASLCKCKQLSSQSALDALIRVNQCGELYAFRSLFNNRVEC